MRLSDLKLNLDAPNALPSMLWGGATGLIVIIVALVIGLVNSTAVVAFIGVILGSGISAATNLVVARAQQREELRRVVVDDRFRAHQEAYEHWDKMKWAIHQPEKVTTSVTAAREWWNKNNLYLDQPARKVFLRCMVLVENFDVYYDEWRHAEKAEKAEADEELEEVWNEIMGTGDVLAKCVDLPGLAGEGEDQPGPHEE